VKGKERGQGAPPETPTARQQQLKELARRLGHRFKDLGLLDQALRHSSYAYENPENGPSNEQLEFLGDAVLNLTVSNLLRVRFPQSSAGELTRGRATLVNARQLASLARHLELGAYLLLGRGEKSQAGYEKPSLVADALEAVLAAIFLDGGLKAAEKLTRKWFDPLLQPLTAPPWQDFKTALQEFAQARYKMSLTYELISARGPGHAPNFVVGVRLGEQLLAQGEGPSKKQASQTAARLALEALEREDVGGGG
jgi:ribonuclease-3